MSLSTHSKFFYGFIVTADNQNFDFSEGSGELTAVVPIGEYTLTDFANALAEAMNDAGALSYSASLNRSTRKITLSASGTFSLLVASGSHIGTTLFGLMGFTGLDRTGSASYQGNLGAGYEYKTQFILQSYVDRGDSYETLYGTVNKSANGDFEVVAFGNLYFVEMNIKYVNDYDHGSSDVIRSDSSGHQKLKDLMAFLVTKAPLEFMPDEDDPNTFYGLRLESTPDDQNGLKFKLKEQYSQGLPGYFETGVLKFRVIEEL